MSSCSQEMETKPVVRIPMTEKCASNKAAMAIAGRALRPCDVCGRERAKWYCQADEAYLCENCDGSVHGANAVSLRHERIRLGPNGMLLKNVKRMSNSEDDDPKETPLPVFGSRKRPRSSRNSVCKVKLEHKNTSNVITSMTKDEEDFLKNSLLAGDLDDELYEAKLELEEESSHQVPVFMPLIIPDDDGGVRNMTLLGGFDVPCVSPTATTDSEDINEGVELCFDPFLEADAADLCDIDGIIAMEDMISDGDAGEVLGLSEDFKEDCSKDFYGMIDFEALESKSNDASDDEDPSCRTPPSVGSVGDDISSKVKLEESDELDKIKLEVDEMLGFAFQAASNIVKEEEALEQKVKLRLNYEDVLNAWSDRGPFWTEGPRPQTVPDDSLFDPTSTWDAGMVPDVNIENLHASEPIGQVPVVNFYDERMGNCGGREARVLRYREKRRTRLFSKKIRYEVRKLNAERRPRLKGRFVKRTINT